MVSVERTHLQMGLVEAQQEAKASPLDPWAILGQSKQAQSLQPHKSRTASPQCFTVKKKAGCISILTSLRALLDTAHQVWHCLWQRLKTVSGNHQCLLQWGTGTLGHLWAMFMHVSTRNTGNRAPPASPHGTIWRGREIQTLPPQPYTLTALHTFQELQMEPVRGNNQKRSWLTNEKVQPRLRIWKENNGKENKILHN